MFARTLQEDREVLAKHYAVWVGHVDDIVSEGLEQLGNPDRALDWGGANAEAARAARVDHEEADTLHFTWKTGKGRGSQITRVETQLAESVARHVYTLQLTYLTEKVVM